MVCKLISFGTILRQLTATKLSCIYQKQLVDVTSSENHCCWCFRRWGVRWHVTKRFACISNYAWNIYVCYILWKSLLLVFQEAWCEAAYHNKICLHTKLYQKQLICWTSLLLWIVGLILYYIPINDTTFKLSVFWPSDTESQIIELRFSESISQSFKTRLALVTCYCGDVT